MFLFYSSSKVKVYGMVIEVQTLILYTKAANGKYKETFTQGTVDWYKLILRMAYCPDICGSFYRQIRAGVVLPPTLVSRCWLALVTSEFPPKIREATIT